MPDMKYDDSTTAHHFSHVRNYVETNRADENLPLDRRITHGEFEQAKARALDLGLHRFG